MSSILSSSIKSLQIVRDVELRTRIDDAFDLGQQFVEIEVFGAGDILEIHLPVDGLDDEDLVARLVADRLDDHVLRADDLLLLDIGLDELDELLAELAGLAHSHAGDVLHLLDGDRVLHGHVLERRILEDDERRQPVLLGHLLTQSP